MKDGVELVEKSALDAVYEERNRLVALAAYLANLGAKYGDEWDAYLGSHPEDPLWDPEWRTIVFLETPAGQMSWHIHDSERPLFNSLRTKADAEWDGHTTEEKYQRLRCVVGGTPLQVWICHACGKTAAKRDDFSDTSCRTHAVLCYADSIEVDSDGHIVGAKAVIHRYQHSPNCFASGEREKL